MCAVDALRLPDLPPGEARRTALDYARQRIRKRQPGWAYARVKRLLDIAAVLVAAPVALPVGLVIALLVKLQDGGPVLFVQARVGRGGRTFGMMKFRTMCVDAEARKEELRHLSIEPWPAFKIPDDPRVTRLGRILRRTYLDELPQLVNVLRGQMSIVGPRPFSFPASTYRLWQTERFDAPPGITGLWQVRRDYQEAALDERLRIDLEYLASRRIRADIGIVVLTAVRLVRRDGR